MNALFYVHSAIHASKLQSFEAINVSKINNSKHIKNSDIAVKTQKMFAFKFLFLKLSKFYTKRGKFTIHNEN